MPRDSGNDIPLQEITSIRENTETVITVNTPSNFNTENPFVFKVIYFLSFASLTTLFTYGWFTMLYAERGIKMIGGVVEGDDEILDKIAFPLAVIATLFDTVANVSLVDFNTASLDWSRSLPRGFSRGLYDFGKKIISSPRKFLTHGVPSISMLLSFPIGGYSNAEPLMPFFKRVFGAARWLPASGLMILSAIYLFITQAKDNMRGVKFYTKPLSPPQQYLILEILFGNWDRKATAFQCLVLELFPGLGSRALGCGYLAGRMAEQEGCDLQTVRFLEILFTIVSLFGFVFARAPGGYIKYYGTAENPLYLVTTEQRNDAYNAKYKPMSWYTYLNTELKRFLNPLGLSETILAGYFGSGLASLLPEVAFLEGWPMAVGLPVGFGLMSASFIYFGIFRRANLGLELNQAAVDLTRNAQNESASTESTTQAPSQANPTTIASTTKLTVLAFLLARIIAALAWIARGLGSLPVNGTMIRKYLKPSETNIVILAIALAVVTSVNGFQYFVKKISLTMQVWLPKIFNYFRKRDTTIEVMEQEIQSSANESTPIIIAELQSSPSSDITIEAEIDTQEKMEEQTASEIKASAVSVKLSNTHLLAKSKQTKEQTSSKIPESKSRCGIM